METYIFSLNTTNYIKEKLENFYISSVILKTTGNGWNSLEIAGIV